jgi:DNA-binding response OmpR family regulator
MANILLLEGDDDVRRLLLIVLARRGHTATAFDADRGVPRDVDLLLLDPSTPAHLDHARRARDCNASLPIVCTRLVHKHEALLASGPLVHLQRPFAAQDLVDAIEQASAQFQWIGWSKTAVTA